MRKKLGEVLKNVKKKKKVVNLSFTRTAVRANRKKFTKTRVKQKQECRRQNSRGREKQKRGK